MATEKITLADALSNVEVLDVRKTCFIEFLSANAQWSDFFISFNTMHT